LRLELRYFGLHRCLRFVWLLDFFAIIKKAIAGVY